MAKMKYDVSASDPDKARSAVRKSPKPGLYVAEIFEINEKDGRNSRGKPDPKCPMWEVVFKITDADKESNKKFIESRMWHYILLEGHPSFEQTVWKLDQFLQAVGVASKKKRKGTVDSDDLIGTEVAILVRAGKDQNDNYRGEVQAVMEYDEDTFGEDSDDDDDEDMDDDDIESREDDDDDDDDSEEDEDEDGDDDDDEDGDEVEPYEEWSVADLREECDNRELSRSGKKADLIARLEEDDEEAEDDDEEEEEPEPPKKAKKGKTTSKSSSKGKKSSGKKKSDDDDDEFPFED